MEKPLTKTSIREYYDKHPEMTRMENIPGCNKWLHSLPLKKTMILFGDNKKGMTKAFGKETGQFTGTRRNHCWIFEEAGIIVVTAATRGTSIEVKKDIELETLKKYVSYIIEKLEKEIKKEKVSLQPPK